MSADNGYVIRPDAEGKYVLQHFFMSAEDWPEIQDTDPRYDDIESAVEVHEIAEDKLGYPTEYGLFIVRKKENA